MNELRELYIEALKDFVADEIRQFRKSQGLSQESMSELLRIDPRSYSDLERKVNSCSALTLACFMLQLEDEAVLQLLKAISALLERIDGHDVA